MEKLKQAISQHWWFLLYIGLAGVFLLLLNQWLWPTPDEYLYANLANSFTAAWHHAVAWQNIDTEHVGLLSALSAVYNSIFSPQTLTASRAVMLMFPLGIIVLLYGMAPTFIISVKHRIWILWLLLLIPGFWVFSVRLMLDIPATLAVGLILYLLLQRRSAIYVSLAVILLLCFREYYVYFIVPMIILIYGIDAVRTANQVWYKPVLYFLGQCGIIIVPLFACIVLLIDFNILPYPRLLENSLVFIFGDIFALFNKHTLIVIDTVSQLVYPHSVAQTIGHLANSNIVEPVTTIIQQNPIIPAASLQDKINTIQLSGTVPTGVVSSQITSTNSTFLEKLWLIYKYNFSEQDINVFILPLAALGFGKRLLTFIRNWRSRYQAARGDLIFGLLLVVFVYLNYHEAGSIHGFRVTLPIIFVLLYFGYFGIHALLTTTYLKVKIIFLILMAGSITLYFFSLGSIFYGSVIAHDSWLSVVLVYKPYIFGGFFILCSLGLAYFSAWQWSHKLKLVAAVVGLLFVVKFVPFYVDAQAQTKLYGYDYGLPDTTTALIPLAEQNVRIYSNVHSYALQYYTQDPRVSTDGISPIIRTFSQFYPNLYYTLPLDDNLFQALIDHNITSVLIVNNDYDQTDWTFWQNLIVQYPENFTKVSGQFKAGRPQWALYTFDAQP